MKSINKVLLPILTVAAVSSSHGARKANHLLNLKWGQTKEYLKVNDHEIVKVVLPASSKEVIATLVEEYQMVTPCEVLKIEQNETQTTVVIQLGETNRDDGDNSCVYKIKGDKSTKVKIGYYIDG